jgi:hypothetical protein
VQLRFRRPDGRPLGPLPDRRSVQAPGLERRNRRHGLQLKPDTCASHWMGDRLDLPLTVDALVAADVRLN